MINLTSRATNSVTIPTRKDTRQKVVDLFKHHLLDLRKRLTVSLVQVHDPRSRLILLTRTERYCQGQHQSYV